MESLNLKSLNLTIEESRDIINYIAPKRGISTKKLLSTIKPNLKRKNNKILTTKTQQQTNKNTTKTNKNTKKSSKNTKKSNKNTKKSSKNTKKSNKNTKKSNKNTKKSNENKNTTKTEKYSKFNL